VTNSYKSSLKFQIIKQNDTFRQINNLSSNEVVLLTYSNDSYYLNAPHEIKDETGKLEDKPMNFQHWRNDKEIDFNGWYIVEHDEASNDVQLRHFNTGRYVTILNKGGDIFDKAILGQKAMSNSAGSNKFIFEPINSNDSKVSNYDKTVVFKIKSKSSANSKEEGYIRIADHNDRDGLAGFSNVEEKSGNFEPNLNSTFKRNVSKKSFLQQNQNLEGSDSLPLVVKER
jgi:hypothetical protein